MHFLLLSLCFIFFAGTESFPTRFFEEMKLACELYLQDCHKHGGIDLLDMHHSCWHVIVCCARKNARCILGGHPSREHMLMDAKVVVLLDDCKHNLS